MIRSSMQFEMFPDSHFAREPVLSVFTSWVTRKASPIARHFEMPLSWLRKVRMAKGLIRGLRILIIIQLLLRTKLT